VKIPKIIHQIWIGPKKCPSKLIDTWREKHPPNEGWVHFLWGNEDILKFKIQNLHHFNAIEEWAGKADIWRYEILMRHGGFFADADSICLKKLDDFLFENESFACFENEIARPNLVANGYIGATENHALMRDLVVKLTKTPSVSQKETGRMAWQNTGPLFFTQTIVEQQHPIAIYPSHIFIPEHYSGKKYEGPGPVYCQQLWGSTIEYSRNPNFYDQL
jgi:mannosyltransferase OCH1-like enzyme